MYTINKITSNTVVDFAAEELKKYLRMMMPRCGEITIQYAPDATDGFRLGLMSDFGLDTSDVKDTELDDILYVDCDEQGGIIAGDNARSVLLAVYRYLRENGCRWLFAGVDGEYIPVCDIKPTKFRKVPSCRYRGQCNEGAEYQPDMMEIIDFTPKVGMNVFMIEFDNPRAYYDQYYNHTGNTKHREPEPITAETALQWKRQCEAEITKRGLQYHDMGHGWTVEAFGIDSSLGWVSVEEDKYVNDEQRQYLAMMDGKRQLFRGIPLNTNFCMSSPVARKKVNKMIVDYAQKATNVDYLHVWLSDGIRNHCECEECQKMIPSDWYIVLMNELDEELRARELKTRIVFCCYHDTTFAPEQIKLKNPDRFSLLLGPVSRNYIESVAEDYDEKNYPLKPYIRNKFDRLPQDINGYLAYAKQWVKACGVPFFVYEYYYWYHHFRDLGVFDSARIIWNDIRGYKRVGGWGVIEDGTQRPFFPNGFSFYVYASTLFDTEVDFEELKEDYFSHAYGEDWREVAAFFEKIGKAVDFRFMHGKLGKKMEIPAGQKAADDPEDNKMEKVESAYYNPDLVPGFESVAGIVDEFAPFVEAHKNMPKRAQTVSYRMLRRYLEYCKGLMPAFIDKALAKDEEAKEKLMDFIQEFGKYELEMERWYDHYMAFTALRRSIFNRF